MTDKNITEFAIAVKNMRDNILAHCEYAELTARVQKTKFDSLVKQGFTQEQALVLCK